MAVRALARGLAPAHAACAGVHVHLRAGQIAATPHGPDGVIASDVIGALPAALAAAPVRPKAERPVPGS